MRYLKSSALQIWLLGYEFPETVMVFLLGRRSRRGRRRKRRSGARGVQPEEGTASGGRQARVRGEIRWSGDGGVEMVLHPKPRSEDGSSQMAQVIDAIRASGAGLAGGGPVRLGVLARRLRRGRCDYGEMGGGSGGSSGGDVLAVKDEGEVINIKKAAFLSTQALKAFVVPKMEVLIDEERSMTHLPPLMLLHPHLPPAPPLSGLCGAQDGGVRGAKMEVLIDEERSMTHAELMEQTEEVITDPAKIKVKLKPDNCDICYPPVFQSSSIQPFSIPPTSPSHPPLHPTHLSIPPTSPSHPPLHPTHLSIPPTSPSHHLSIPPTSPSHPPLHPTHLSIPPTSPSHLSFPPLHRSSPSPPLHPLSIPSLHPFSPCIPPLSLRPHLHKPLAVQSGWQYDLRASAASRDDPLCYDFMGVIICAITSLHPFLFPSPLPCVLLSCSERGPVRLRASAVSRDNSFVTLLHGRHHLHHPISPFPSLPPTPIPPLCFSLGRVEGNMTCERPAVSSDDPLCYDSMGVIICAIGARYASYCSNVARTYLIDATKAQEKAYQVLLRAQEAAIAAIKPGVRLGDVYRAAVAVVEREAPELVPHLTKTRRHWHRHRVPRSRFDPQRQERAHGEIGHGVQHGAVLSLHGLTNPKFREAGLTLNAKNERTVKSGMAFNVVLGLHGLTNPEAGGGEGGVCGVKGHCKGKEGTVGSRCARCVGSFKVFLLIHPFKEGGVCGVKGHCKGKEGTVGSRGTARVRKALWGLGALLLVADTVAVRASADKDRWVDVATASASKSFADVAYSLKGEDEEEEDTDKGKRPAEAAGAGEPAVFARAHLRSENQEATKEELRRQHQAELAKQKIEETARRLAAGGLGAREGEGLRGRRATWCPQAELAKQKIEETARRLAAGGLGAREGEGAKRQTGDLVLYGDVDEIPLAMKDYKIQLIPLPSLSLPLLLLPSLLVDQRHESVLLCLSTRTHTFLSSTPFPTALAPSPLPLSPSSPLSPGGSAPRVDQRHESVLLPIYGLLVPFHVCMIRNVTSQQDGGHIYIRIIFNVPGAGFNAADLPMQKFPDSIFIKELSFKSTDSRHANQVAWSASQQDGGHIYIRIIFNVPGGATDQDHEQARAAAGGRSALRERHLSRRRSSSSARAAPPRLPDLWIRPSFGGKGRKLTGSLEAHLNGFRYSTAKAHLNGFRYSTAKAGCAVACGGMRFFVMVGSCNHSPAFYPLTYSITTPLNTPIPHQPDERVEVMYGNIKHAFTGREGGGDPDERVEVMYGNSKHAFSEPHLSPLFLTFLNLGPRSTLLSPPLIPPAGREGGGDPDERVEVMYGNIKHAFFQPAENEMITLLHFHLHNPIMVGKKKTKDVQFFAEVMEVVQTVGGSRRSAYDPDEIEEEQRAAGAAEQDQPGVQILCQRGAFSLGEGPRARSSRPRIRRAVRELGFHGVPHKSSAFIVPTVNCLVELIEVPFLVVTLNEVEIVNLERVGLGQKTFDMAIVFKDFKRDVLRIDAIPSTSLDSAFLADGGWEFLNLEASDSEGEESEESQAYEPSDLEEAASDDDDDESEDDESVVDSEEEEGEEEEEEEEEGPDLG
ncbi:unnamed protein product [Closterium sp. NIES-65]|nr:unnamed protein product [Closterium sp. NIES-65]